MEVAEIFKQRLFMPLTKEQETETPSVCVCVHVCLQPCMVAYKQSSALAQCTTAAERGLSHRLSPPTPVSLLLFLSPTFPSLLSLTTK